MQRPHSLVKTEDSDTVVIGSGVAGVLVARALAAAGRNVTIVERGSFVPWREQARRLRWEGSSPTSEHNHENDPEGLDWDWDYVYGVGGSMNRWLGATPRLLPEDFEMRSRFGVGRDWPLSYDELAPDYLEAERLLAVAGKPNPLTPGSDYPLPPHPLSPQDRVLEPHLSPFINAPQARPTRPVRGRPACCGSARCWLCPVNARFSVLNGFGNVLTHPRVRLIDDTIAVRFLRNPSGRRISSVECVNAKGQRLKLHGSRFVLAANGIESPALLLRSDMAYGDTGRFLADHGSGDVTLLTVKPVHPGRGSSLATGVSYRYYPGGFRSRRAAILLEPNNPGSVPGDLIIERLAAGRSGRRLRREVAAEWERTLVVSILLDDLPDKRNHVRLSAQRDGFGIPRNRILFTGPSEYQRRAVRHLLEDLPRRLKSLGVRNTTFAYSEGGTGHLLGALRMGSDDAAVVDRELRHRRYENLFVSGGAVFPTIGAIEPTLTIAALALRLGRHMTAETA